MSSKIRLAVVGAGHLGRFHARLAAAMDAFDLVAVVDPHEDTCRNVADEVGVQASGSHAEILDQIDAAVVATPTQYHHHVTMDLLQAGCDVLVEKPLAHTASQAQELVDCAASHDRVLQVGHIERFNPALVAIRSQLQSPKYIEARRYSGYSFRSTDIGVVMDVMIHDLDLILDLVGDPPTTVDALGVSVLGGCEDVADVRLAFAGGCVAHLTASRISYHAEREMQVWCPDLFAAVHFADSAASIVRPREAALQTFPAADTMTAEEKQRAKEQLFEEYLPVEQFTPEPRNALQDELADFASAIGTGQPPQVSGAAGLAAVQLCDRILEQIEAHKWDGLPEGRRGPFAALQPSVLRAPSWHADQRPHRRAG